PEAVVGVAQVRRQRRAVGHRAPRVLVAPGAPARDAAPAVLGPPRIALGRSRVVALVLPVETPFVADAGQGEEAPPVGRRLDGPGRPIEARRRRPGLAPREPRRLEPAARRLLPLRLRRQ